MTDEDLYVRMQEVAPADWNAELMERATRATADLDGAGVADVLAVYDGGDAFVGERETLAEEHAELFSRYRQDDCRVACVYALIAGLDPVAVVQRLARPAGTT